MMKNKSQSSDKKLKQARLPFKTLSPRSPGIDQASAAKKRKLSNSSQDPEVVIRKVFVKENIDNSNDVEIVSEHKEVVQDINKEKLNPVVSLVDNVEELIQQCNSVKAKVEEVIDLSDSSNSSQENSFVHQNSLDSSEVATNDNSNLEIETPQKASASPAQCEVNDDPSLVEDICDEGASRTKSQDSNTPTQNKKTPKQVQKQQESAKKKEEKEKARLEKERLKQEEKEQRLKQKQEKDEQKKREREEKEEQKRKEKEEKEEQRRKEKEEKEKKRLAEIEMKNEERRLKEEDKRKKEELKEEEKKKKDLLREEKLKREKLEKEEAELKQKKAAAAFANFFLTKKANGEKNEECTASSEDNEADKDKLNFMPFSLKADMRLAPIIRHSINSVSKERLDNILNSKAVERQLYTEAIKDPMYKIGKSTKTWEFSEKDVIVIAEEGEAIVESYTPQQHNRPKLLQFHENRRPPYWGTWTKNSSCVGPRTPFGKDKILDYEIDSDSEWEEEEPGESLNGSDDEKEKEESEDEYEVDNDFFVPHGYLSDEEQDNAEELESSSPETLKVKLKLLQSEFNEEMKKKTEKIKPRLFGCIWSNADGSKPDKCVDTIWNMLKQSAMMFEDPIILAPAVNDVVTESETPGPGAKLTKLTEILLPDLIKLIHGNEYSRSFLIKEFYAYVLKHHQNIQKQDISKSAIGRKIHEIAKYTTVKDDVSGTSKRCWFVEQSSRDACNMTDLPLENAWIYTLKHRKSEKICDDSQLEVKKRAITPSHISKFTKTLSEDDRKKQFDIPKLDAKADSTSKVKKRVALISVPIGSKFPPNTASKPEEKLDSDKTPTCSKDQISKPKSRVNLLSSFITRTEEKYSNSIMPKDAESAGSETKTSGTKSANMDVDDYIELSD